MIMIKGEELMVFGERGDLWTDKPRGAELTRLL